jgi:hypothetical protein
MLAHASSLSRAMHHVVNQFETEEPGGNKNEQRAFDHYPWRACIFSVIGMFFFAGVVGFCFNYIFRSAIYHILKNCTPRKHFMKNLVKLMRMRLPLSVAYISLNTFDKL